MASREHYSKQFCGEIDVYRICRLYNITDPAIYHAIKKLLRSGDSDKSKADDVRGAKVALERWLEIEQEDKAQDFDKEVEEIADKYREELEGKLFLDLPEEDRRDLLYDFLSIMEGRDAFLNDNLATDVHDLNNFINHVDIDVVNELLEKIRKMPDPLNYILSRESINV